MSQITVLYVPIYIIVLYFHQVLRLTVTYYQVILPRLEVVSMYVSCYWMYFCQFLLVQEQND